MRSRVLRHDNPPTGTTQCTMTYTFLLWRWHCQRPATHHLICPGDPLVSLQTCGTHYDEAAPNASHTHSFTSICGMPDTVWRLNPDGSSHCYWPAAETIIAEHQENNP